MGIGVRVIFSELALKSTLTPLSRGQLPGLSGHDVAGVARKVFDLANRVGDFAAIAQMVRNGERATLRERLRQLEADLQHSGDHSRGVPTLQKP